MRRTPDHVAAPRTVEELSAALDTLEYEPGHNVVEEALAAALEIEREAAAADLPEVVQRARLVQADMSDRMGNTTGGARLAWEVNRWAAEHDHRALLASSHLLLATTYHNLGDPAACLEHAAWAVELLDDTTPPRVRATHLTKLGDALGWTGSFDAARQRYRAAENLLVSIGDAYRHLVVLNNLAYTEYEAGEPTRAMEVTDRMVAVARANDTPLEAMFLDTIGRVQLALGRYEEAEHTMEACLTDYHARGYEEGDGLAEYLLTMAEIQRRLEKTDRAQETLDRCRAICDERQLAEIRVRVGEEQAELYAAAGDFRRAYEAHKAFHSESEALRSFQREAQARGRQELLETAEARQDAQRFRELALRDPLTGLYNRRFVDERLPALLYDAAQTGAPLSVALVDLDHFKGVNDTLSHDVGDQVLIAIAALLLASVAPAGGVDDITSGFVARIGGEEFLIAMPETTGAEASHRCEELRLAVRAHAWRPITGDLAVTVSVGVTSVHNTVHTPTGHLDLIADADRNLYVAKRGGRDQVVADAPHPPGERRRYRART